MLLLVLWCLPRASLGFTRWRTVGGSWGRSRCRGGVVARRGRLLLVLGVATSSTVPTVVTIRVITVARVPLLRRVVATVRRGGTITSMLGSAVTTILTRRRATVIVSSGGTTFSPITLKQHLDLILGLSKKKRRIKK